MTGQPPGTCRTAALIDSLAAVLNVAHDLLLWYEVTAYKKPSDYVWATDANRAGTVPSDHGETGAGNGPAAGALAPSPTNFHLKRPTEERVWNILENGVPGTAMPPWRSELSTDQRRALVEFVRSLYGMPQENSGQCST